MSTVDFLLTCIAVNVIHPSFQYFSAMTGKIKSQIDVIAI